MRRRRPPLRSIGTDPDYRFTLANERTFLAWLRTGLALVAGAVALASLVPDLGPRPVRIVVTLMLLVLALVLTAGAYARWDRAERALRENRPLPADPLPKLLASGVFLVVLGIAVLVIVSELHTEAQGQFPPWPGMILLAFGVIAAAVLAPARYLSILRAVRSTRTPLATLAIAGAATLTLGAAVGAAAALLPR